MKHFYFVQQDSQILQTHLCDATFMQIRFYPSPTE
jgi:hypothetical protein